jgi:putative ABC transport system permease protein
MRIIRTSDDSTTFIKTLLERVEILPGVKSAGVAVSVPLSGRDDITEFRIEGQPDPRPGQPRTAGLRAASARYFETLGIPLLRGRFFTEDDNESPGHEKVAIVNQALIRRYFPNTHALGRRVTLGGWRRIVGVVGDVHHSSFEASAEPEIYAPYALGSKVLTLAVRTRSDPRSFIGAIRAQVTALDPNQPVFSINTTDDLVSSATATRRYSMTLLGIFAAFALLLAVLGVYSVTAYSVARRSQEIGIRMALGANGEHIRRLVVRESSWVMAVGLAVGVTGAAELTRYLDSLLYRIRPADPMVMIGAVALLATLGVTGALRPAARAARIDPASAIRLL